MAEPHRIILIGRESEKARDRLARLPPPRTPILSCAVGHDLPKAARHRLGIYFCRRCGNTVQVDVPLSEL